MLAVRVEEKALKIGVLIAVRLESNSLKLGQQCCSCFAGTSQGALRLRAKPQGPPAKGSSQPPMLTSHACHTATHPTDPPSLSPDVHAPGSPLPKGGGYDTNAKGPTWGVCVFGEGNRVMKL